MGSLLGCCYGCCCCEFNSVIFPAPFPSYHLKDSYNVINTFINSNQQQVPYLELKKPSSKFNIIYFHGNAQDIGYSASFLIPIHEETQANIYAIQYPCYGAYSRAFGAKISTDIKSNALQFYEYLSKIYGLTPYNTVVLGRSIGSGGACYLANRKNIKKLILISPFTTIPSVARDYVGCIGSLIREHFNNEEQLSKFKGKLLIIHGKIDEVIGCKHGQSLAEKYRENGGECEFISPQHMTHNYFSMEDDIVRPIHRFTTSA